MPRIGRGISGYRNVLIEFSNAHDTVDGSETSQIAAPIDAFKGVIKLVEEIEAAHHINARTDETGLTVLVTGAINHNIHVFTLTLDISAALYEFLYVETVPAPEDVS